MAFLTVAKPATGDPTLKSLIDDIIDNQLFLNGVIASVGGLVINSSFEADEDSDGDPDNWDITDRTGGSHALDTSNDAHGANGLKFTSTVLANGGGYGDTSDYIAVAAGEIYPWKCWRVGSVADISCQMTITWYTGAKASISTTTLFQDADTPTARTLTAGVVTAPSTARFAKIRVEGGVPSVGTATGDIIFDNPSIDEPYPVLSAGQSLWSLVAAYPVGSPISDQEITEGIDDTYDIYKIVGIGLSTTTGPVSLRAEISDDLGSTYHSTLYDYDATTGAALWQLTGAAWESATSDKGHFELTLYKPHDSAIKPTGKFSSIGYGVSLIHYVDDLHLGRSAAGIINAIKFSFSSGNIDAGTFYLLGMRK